MILITAALKAELLPLIEYYKAKPRGNWADGRLFVSEKIHLLRTGVGMDKARHTLSAYLEKYEPEKIINTGTAGALNPRFTIGLMTEPEIIYNEKKQIIKPHPLYEDQYLLKQSKLLSVTAPVINQEQKNKLLKDFDADMVDMEAFAIAYLAGQRNIKFHCVKIISDFANDQTADDFKNNYKIIIEKLSGYLIKYLEASR
ncbi:MAG: hypothetical protein JW956_13805 [Calditrichaceae bacterium]|nr:hypothetical protein [Calditrichaceae bacterium]